MTHLHSLQVQRNDSLIHLPLTTQRNLELTQTLRGEPSPTLFSLLDTCQSGMGSRALRHWLLHPECNRTAAQQRLQAIGVLRECGLRVHDARIATFGERAEDLFQISDERDQPLRDAPQRQALREALLAALDGEPR